MSKNYFRINSGAVCRNVILFNTEPLDTKAIHECLFIWKRRKAKICALSLLWTCVNRYGGRHPTPSKHSLFPRSPSFFASTVQFFQSRLLQGHIMDKEHPQFYRDILLGFFFHASMGNETKQNWGV